MASLASAAVARPFTPEDLVQINRLGDTAVSPGSTAVAYIQSQYSVDSKRKTTKLSVQPLNDNNHSVEVVIHSADARVNPPKASANENSEDDDSVSGSPENKLKPSQPVWLSESVLGFVAPDKTSGGSTLYSGILAFIASVYNGTSTREETADIDRHEQERADTAQVYEDLWVRHWDTYVSPRLPQIHTLKLVPANDNSFKPMGQPRNIIKDTEVDGRLEASHSFVFSPNGQQIAFVAKKPGKYYAWKTTSYIYSVDIDGSAAIPINPGNGGASSSPSFNHDGTKIAYVQMAKPTYWADRKQIKIYDIAEKTTVNVAADWDRSPAQLPINYSAIDSPNNLYTTSMDGSDLTKVTDMNPEFGNGIELSVPEDVEFVGADNATIHGFLLRPPQFYKTKKYPLALIIHGPHWNLNTFAASGFVAVALNPQGSTGYGQAFTDAVNQWGGKPYDSLMMWLEQLLEAHPYVDRNRVAALGYSYGGYMVNRINGHTDVFKALVNP
ncbi:dipeptidylpeptidase [Coemansia erecta]|nr:dipeptidylpeptidase [Coemansia erecta]